MHRLSRPFLIAVLIFVAISQTAWSREWRFDDVSRIVAIADIHGAYDAMVTTLQNADILADDLSWAGGESHLVIVGDILDRGPKSRAAMDLLMRLEGEAMAAGGQVHVLIGNHESMILTGDMRYVSAPEYAAFAHESDPGERQLWFEMYARRNGGASGELRATFDKEFPQGYFAMRRAFRADGHYGKWLSQKNIIVVINGTAFVHGGLPPVVTEVGLEGINDKQQKDMAEYIETLAKLADAGILLPTDSHYDYEKLLTEYTPGAGLSPEVLQAVRAGIRLGDSDLLSTDGPLWYRNNILCPGIVEEHRLEAALTAIDATRVVIGHTPTPSRQVMQRFDGRVIEIDTGMLNFYYQGIGHALVIEGESVSVTDQTGMTSLLPVNQGRKVGRRPNDLNAEDLARLLQMGEATVVAKADTLTGRTLVELSDGNSTVSAIFNKNKGRGFYPNVAAYRLDRLLNLEMVPVSVIRELDGKSGSLQFLPDNSIDEAERSASAQGGGAWCSINDQWPEMYVFDVLVHNEGRSQRRMLYDKSDWRLILSEHDRAFAAKKGRPAHLKSAQLAVHAGWKDALVELGDEVLDASLGDVLDKRRLRALKSRRDALLAIP